jgi:hypothetical protein
LDDEGEETMKLENVHPGTVVRLEDGQVAVAAVGPGRGRRYVMQESGVMLDTRGDQEVEILDVPWSSHLGRLLIEACRRWECCTPSRMETHRTTCR